MDLLFQKNWTSGSGKSRTFEQINETVSKHSKNNKIFIGSDSFLTKNRTCFVTAVCLLNENSGNKYYFYKDYVPTKKYKMLSVRITEEVRRSIEIAEYFMNSHNIAPNDIELHLDVSPFSANNGTSRFSDMLKGHVQGYGFECRLKPNAWASQSVADRHSK